MATGKRAFEGKSQASLISRHHVERAAAVVAARAADSSRPSIGWFWRASAKDPDERDPERSRREAPAPVDRRRRRAVRVLRFDAPGVAHERVGLLGAGGGARRSFDPGHARTAPVARRPRLRSLPRGSSRRVSCPRADLACPPMDARWRSWRRDSSGEWRIWLRPMGSLESRPIPGTEKAVAAHSGLPINKSVAFVANGKLQRVPVRRRRGDSCGRRGRPRRRILGFFRAGSCSMAVGATR